MWDETSKYLIKMEADVNSKTESDFTPLHVAARFGNVETMKYLIENGADINSKNKDGMTLLNVAACKVRIFHPICSMSLLSPFSHNCNKRNEYLEYGSHRFY